MKNEDFEFTKEKKADSVKFVISGRINSANSDELQYILDEAVKEGAKNIVLNMLRVEYMSSAGIRVVINVYKDAKEAGGKLGIEMPSENVRNVLGMIALDEMLID